MKNRFLVFLTVIVIMLTCCSCVTLDNNVENYDRDVSDYQATSFMPDLSEIGEYQDIDYLLRKDDLIFPCYTLRLIVKYEEDEFLKEKERLKSAYTYLDAPQKADFDDTFYSMPVTQFSAAGFQFKVAVFDDTEYPKNFGMVGMSNGTCEIAYLWMYSPDHDSICEEGDDVDAKMREFVEYIFAFEHDAT